MSQGFTRGVPIDIDPNLAANSNLLVPSQAAVIAYVNSRTGGAATTGPTIYTLDGSLLNNRTVNLNNYNLVFSGGGYSFTFNPSTGNINTNFNFVSTSSSNSFQAATIANLTVSGSFNFAGATSTFPITVTGTASSTLGPGYLQLTPMSSGGLPSGSGTSGFVYISSTNGNLYYRDVFGVDFNLQAATNPMVWPTSPGLAYYGGSNAWSTSITTSAGLAGVITDETGTGALVFGTSPTITTSLVAGSSSFDLVNTVATTVNFAQGATTVLAMGANTGTISLRSPIINFSSPTSPLSLVYNGGAATPILNLFDTNIIQLNFVRDATAITVGSAAGGSTITFREQNFGISGTDPSISTATNLSNGTAHIFNEHITKVRLFNAADTVTIGGSTSLRTFGTNPSSVDNSGSTTLNLMIGPTAASNTKTFNIGTGGSLNHRVNVTIGSTNTDLANSTTLLYTKLQIQGDLIVNGTQTTINSTTLQVTDKNIELGNAVAVSGATGTLSGTVTVTLTGTSTTAGMVPGQSLTKVVGSGVGVFGTNAKIATITGNTTFTTDVTHNTLGSLSFNTGGPDNSTASGGGITLFGTTNKKLFWEDGVSKAQWTSTEDFNLQTSKVYRINDVSVLSNSTLGANIINSSLTKVGALSGGTAGFVKVDATGNLTSDSNSYVTPSSLTTTLGSYQTTNANLISLIGLSPTTGNLILGNGSSWTVYSPGTSGQVLTSTGTSSAPTWQTPTTTEPTFANDLSVYLSGTKSFGKYQNGSIIPATGKTAREVIQMAITETQAPTATLILSNTTSGYRTANTIYLNQTAVSNVLNFTKTAIAPATGFTTGSGAVLLEWRRNNTGTWTTLTTDASLTTFTHTLTDTVNNAQPFNYRYTVTDNLGTSTSVTFDVTPTYTAPTIVITALGTSTQPSTNTTTRELGNINTYVIGTITRNNPNINPTSYTIDYSTDGGTTWITISSGTVNTYPTQSISSSLLSPSVAAINSTSMKWRIVATDSVQGTAISSTINFFHKNFILYSTSSTIGMTEINAATSTVTFTNAKNITFTGVTATSTQYTYYVYASSAGNLTGVIQDGAAPVLGAFTLQTDVTGTNSYGATVSYRIYKSNALGAFTNNSLAFS